MTKDTIVENCKRLLAFYKETAEISFPIEVSVVDREINTSDLLHWYARTMDVNGCPSIGLGLLFIKDKGEYNEAKEHCLINFKNTFIEVKEFEVPRNFQSTFGKSLPTFPPRFKFDYDGYKWEVINK